MSALVGMAGIVGTLYFVFTYKTAGFSGYFDLPSAVLLAVMPPCIMLLSHSLQDIFTGMQLLFSSMFSRLRRQQEEVVEQVQQASQLVRSEGLGALVNVRKQVRYPLLAEGLSMIVNDYSVNEIQKNLMDRAGVRQSRMQLAANLFENMSKVCPGVGMIGTLLGLIAMMSNMTDPSKIGAGMALAMITTLYGIMLGTIIYAPWGEKIALEAEKAHEIDQMVINSVLNIKGKKSSLHLKNIVSTYSQNKKKPKGA